MACPILVVDDDPDIRETLGEILEAEGYRSAIAANGQEALDYLHQQPSPALILLDLMMPIMDGFEFRDAQLQEAELRDIPIVVISAGGRSQQAAQDLGAIGYLEKPIDLKLMFEMLRSVCALPAGA